MPEREREAAREREAEAAPTRFYDTILEQRNEENEKRKNGRIVIKGKEIPFEQGRHGILKYYLFPSIGLRRDCALNTMELFVHELRTHSGRHTHQGGLAIFVLEGKGYTIVDGVRYDWEAGDAILLPVKPGGCEHQHFNLDTKPSRWLALSPETLRVLLDRNLVQNESHPDWKGIVGA
ncbi:cupin domain-containing protein [Chloroflexota bacterium]